MSERLYIPWVLLVNLNVHTMYNGVYVFLCPTINIQPQANLTSQARRINVDIYINDEQVS